MTCGCREVPDGAMGLGSSMVGSRLVVTWILTAGVGFVLLVVDSPFGMRCERFL